MTLLFVLAQCGKLNANGDVFTAEALVQLRDQLLEKKVIELKDAKGPYSAKVHTCYVDNDRLMVEAETR